MPEYKILPSILSADPMHLGDEIVALRQAGADFIHFDVMDNHYVPNLSFGPLLAEAILKSFPALPLDVHLMVSPVDALIQDFASAGVQRISIHPEASLHPDRSLCLIQQLGCKAGLVLNPGTDIHWLNHLRPHLDFVLVMLVNPGFAGQKANLQLCDKIASIAKRYPDLPIAVDGGVSANNIKTLAQAGASEFIAGSALFNSGDLTLALSKLRQALR